MKADVKVIDISWQQESGKNFLDLTSILEKYAKDDFYRTFFAIALIKANWDKYLPKIILFGFVPWASQSFLSQIYNANVLDSDRDSLLEDGLEAHWILIGLVILILSLYLLFIEYK